VDTYNDDEALTGFEVAFEESVDFPIVGTVIGQEVRVSSVTVPNGRRELIARCEHQGRRYDLALLDEEDTSDSAFDRILAAYCKWLGV
jgi:hypothetical protein